MPSPTTIQANTESNWAIIRRLLGLSWRYRAGCIKVFIYQLVLLAMGLTGLGLTGLGIDYIRYQIQSGVKPPHWPFGFVPPATWSALTVLAVIAGVMLVLAVSRAVLNYMYSVAVAVLVERYI